MKTDRYLLDTNILFRLKNTADSDNPTAVSVIRKILGSGSSIYTCSQNMIEYRVVATRPVEMNGYGLTSIETTTDIADYELNFPILLDTQAQQDIYPIWRKLVESAGTLGKRNHDARILAVAVAHVCTHLLTFNHRDFERYQSVVPEVIIINPHDV